MEYYSSLEMDEVLAYAITWMILKTKWKKLWKLLKETSWMDMS